MGHVPDQLTDADAESARERRLVAMHLQEIEGNPLDSEDIVMFEMFERERWSHEKRIAHIIERATMARFTNAAE
ncbi:hypothetical protein [Bosea sp. (in: a-proteobacteria)]|jgi:hypothetical protein|uniref:hypothetical protein n=1 Tax=Bosea sp. (in: a-proteobacteria) TaxID=1871050 RepID=UPI0035683FEB